MDIWIIVYHPPQCRTPDERLFISKSRSVYGIMSDQQIAKYGDGWYTGPAGFADSSWFVSIPQRAKLFTEFRYIKQVFNGSSRSRFRNGHTYSRYTVWNVVTGEEVPAYMHERMKLIKASGAWWENLPRLEFGFLVMDVLRQEDFRIVVLTQGPKENPTAWSHKVAWCMKNLPGTEITITRDKSLVYGKILVDDYPGYIQPWLEWRPRGLVIMPAQPHNHGFVHPQVVRFDGTNLDEVRARIAEAKKR